MVRGRGVHPPEFGPRDQPQPAGGVGRVHVPPGAAAFGRHDDPAPVHSQFVLHLIHEVKLFRKVGRQLIVLEIAVKKGKRWENRKTKFNDDIAPYYQHWTNKARFHMRFLMRFLMRFRVQNAPDPILHECLFHEASCGLERKVSHIIWRHPSFEFLPIWRYFVAALRDYKPVQGRLGQVLWPKSHRKSHV